MPTSSSTPTITSQHITSTLLSTPLPIPTHGPGGTFTILVRTSISAPPLTVLNTVRDTKNWARWNSFCPRAEILKPGMGVEIDGDGDGDGDENGIGGEGKEGWLKQGTEARIDVFMHGDGMVVGRERSRVQDVVVTFLSSISSSSPALSPSFSRPSNPSNLTGLSPTAGQKERKGYRIAWKINGWSHWQLHSERVMEFLELEDEEDGKGTEYVCWETYGGILGAAVKATVGGQLVDRFRDYAGDLRGWCERGNGGRGVEDS